MTMPGIRTQVQGQATRRSRNGVTTAREPSLTAEEHGLLQLSEAGAVLRAHEYGRKAQDEELLEEEDGHH